MDDFDDDFASPGAPASELEAAFLIDANAMDDECVRLPSDLAFYGEKHAEMTRKYLLAKAAREETYALVSRESRFMLEGSSKGRVTVGEVEAEALLSPAFQKAKRGEIYAEAETLKLRNQLEALRAKRDMLMQIGAQKRAEMQLDPSARMVSAVDRARSER